jgi:hypothetical protein
MAGDSVLESLFASLAERLRQENDLSDLTWAACQAAPELGEAFARFFGVNEHEAKGISLEREYPLGDGRRIDFALLTGSGLRVFVENKIWDRNYHFKDYAGLVQRHHQGAPLFLLTNHRPEAALLPDAEQLGWEIRHWQELVEFIEHQASAEPSADLVDKDQRSSLAGEGRSTELIRAWTAYVKAVCDMVEIRRLHLDPTTLYSLVSLGVLIDEFIGSSSSGDFVYKKYQTRRSHASGCSGSYYELTFQPSDARIWPFFGLDFEKPEHVYLALWLDTDWNRAFIVAHRAELMKTTGFEFYESDWGIGLRVSHAALEDLLQLDLPEQRSRLSSFFLEANKILENLMRRS